MSKKTNKFNFETSLTELEATIAAMESGKLSLEDSLQNFEKGIALIRQCQNALKDSEQKVQLLLDEKLQPYTAEEK